MPSESRGAPGGGPALNYRRAEGGKVVDLGKLDLRRSIALEAQHRSEGGKAADLGKPDLRRSIALETQHCAEGGKAADLGKQVRATCSGDSLFCNLRGCPVQEFRNIPWVPPEKPRDRRNFRRIYVELLPGVPFERKVYHGAGLGDLLQRPQRCPQHCELTSSVVGRAQGQSEGLLDRGDARDTGTLGQFRHHGKRNSAEPGRFDLSLHQSHGPAAHRSNRNQHDGIHVFLPKLGDDAGNRMTQERVGPDRIPHIGIMRRG